MAFTRPKASQINFDTTNITDPLIRLNSGQTGSADKDSGIVIERGDNQNVAIVYDESADQFVFINTTENGTTSGNVTISSYANIQVNSITSVGAFTTDGISINDNNITTTRSNDDLVLDPSGTGNVLLGNFAFDADQTVGAGQDNYVLTYDNATGLVSLEESVGGGGIGASGYVSSLLWG